jgi:adenosylmethionine-8-amino-7-oxononanoate aminotransferase
LITPGTWSILVAMTKGALMTTPARATDRLGRLEELAREHLWMPFNPINDARSHRVPVIVSGDGCHLTDAGGNRYLDTFASICCVAVGHGRAEILDEAVAAVRNLPYADIWQRSHPVAIELAAQIAELAPEGVERVFFTSGGSEAVESAVKLARQYNQVRGKPRKTKVIARETAYHGTTLGALAMTGITPMRAPFEPLAPGVSHVPNTNTYQLRDGADPTQFADAIEHRILFEDPETVAAVILEPVQNGGGCIPPPQGYFQRVRDICDRHDVLLISDEVICAWGRLGEWFGAQRYEYRPDLVTTAKAITSGYAPLGALLISDKVSAPFLESGTSFLHGFTFCGHPLACAIASVNLRVIEEEGLLENVRAREQQLRGVLESMADIPIVGDVRGAGFFQAIEFVRDQTSKEPFAPEHGVPLTAGIRKRGLERGLILRSDVRGAPVLQVAPPLVAGDEFFEQLATGLRPVLEEAAHEALA